VEIRINSPGGQEGRTSGNSSRHGQRVEPGPTSLVVDEMINIKIV
jgi:hypothetical protein